MSAKVSDVRGNRSQVSLFGSSALNMGDVCFTEPLVYARQEDDVVTVRPQCIKSCELLFVIEPCMSIFIFLLKAQTTH